MKSNGIIEDRTVGISRLLEIMRRLRDKDSGCPWDIEQDFASIAPYMVEEAYEVADAIERQAWGDLPGELGDVLLNVVFHAQMADEARMFDFDAVVQAVSDKMVARHPHVFGDESREKSAEQQVADWEELKAVERGAPTSVLDGVAPNLPALTRALKLQNRAARVGFDWPETVMVLDKINEESAELVEAHEKLSAAEVEEEFGDLLFVITNLGRHLGVSPEEALRKANAKFTRRFNAVETALKAKGSSPQNSDLAEMDALWEAAKRAEK
ncbi:MAG: nucleoside triphosphate pyrophosphohydrolase [Rhodobacteraceae bacterium]|nr:nucleoside triphosphate pyrophosphohydrolase [Paracoccaceae bacterium]